MTVTRDNVLDLLKQATEHSIEYQAAVRQLHKTAKLFKTAALMLESGRLYEEIANLTSVAVSEYGEDCVSEVVKRAAPHSETLSHRACMWVAVALAFAHNPVEEYLDNTNQVHTMGNDIWAQVCHTTRGAHGAWDEYAQLHPGLLRMANPGTSWAVNKMLADIWTFGLIETHTQFN